MCGIELVNVRNVKGYYIQNGMKWWENGVKVKREVKLEGWV